MPNDLDILVVDDETLDRMQVRRCLDRSDLSVMLHEAADAEEARSIYATRGFDCILIDNGLPGVSGLEFLSELVNQSDRVPAIIMLSGGGNDMLAAQALKSGADDYLAKSALTPESLERAVRSAVKIATLRNSAEQSEMRRAADRDVLAKAEEIAGMGSWKIDKTDGAVAWSAGMYRMLGLTRSEEPPSLEMLTDLMDSETRTRFINLRTRMLEMGEPFETEFQVLGKDNRKRSLYYVGRPVRDSRERITGANGIVQDITARRLAEVALERTNRVEAIGALSGGIAHDFNNLLGIIQGNLDLIRRKIGADEALQKRLDAVAKATQRGSDLTRKLLNVSRHEKGVGEPTDIAALVQGLEDILARSVTNRIGLHIYGQPGLWAADIVRGDLEDAIINLVINGRDAMPNGGDIYIELANKTTDRLPNLGLIADNSRDFVVLSVSDTGTGMPGHIRDRVLEPFFSTKEKSKGTGLGLSMVYAFAKRSGGDVNVYSEVGIGTTVQVYLPRSSSSVVEAAGQAETRQTADELRGDELILFVDDEPELRNIGSTILRDHGYRVVLAIDVETALEVLEIHDVDLVVTDVVMPGQRNGVDLASEVRRRSPPVPVILSSGFSGNLTGKICGEPNVDFVDKPYTAMDLLQAVRNTLNAARRGGEGDDAAEVQLEGQDGATGSNRAIGPEDKDRNLVGGDVS